MGRRRKRRRQSLQNQGCAKVVAQIVAKSEHMAMLLTAAMVVVAAVMIMNRGCASGSDSGSAEQHRLFGRASRSISEIAVVANSRTNNINGGAGGC